MKFQIQKIWFQIVTKYLQMFLDKVLDEVGHLI